MEKLLRIGGLAINPSQICYVREQGDRLHLFMACGLLTLEKGEAAVIREHLAANSEILRPLAQPLEPELPRWAVERRGFR